MRMLHKDRTSAGFKAEDATAKELKAKGYSVKQNPRNQRGHDLVVNGKKVEVKAAVETSYKGSDGYPITGFVFSNMHTAPDADKYILKCMSPDRRRVLKEYHIPAKEVKQRTLTITKSSKYEQFKKASDDVRTIGGVSLNDYSPMEQIKVDRSLDWDVILARIAAGTTLKLIRGYQSTGKVDFADLTRPRKSSVSELLTQRYMHDVGESLYTGSNTSGYYTKVVGRQGVFGRKKDLLDFAIDRI